MFDPLSTGNPKTGTLASSVDPDEMQHKGSALFVKIKQPSGKEIHHNLENTTCDS